MRKDNWTLEDDKTLAETVLHFISTGRTQLAAFDEAGDKLERTSAACGFRWNSEVRKRYSEQFDEARSKRRLEKQKSFKQREVNISQQPNKVGDLTSLNELIATIEDSMKRLKGLCEELQSENILLRKKVIEKPSNEDLEVLMGLISNARSMGLLSNAKTS